MEVWLILLRLWEYRWEGKEGFSKKPFPINHEPFFFVLLLETKYTPIPKNKPTPMAA
jgi:hypothetical protein